MTRKLRKVLKDNLHKINLRNLLLYIKERPLPPDMHICHHAYIELTISSPNFTLTLQCFRSNIYSREESSESPNILSIKSMKKIVPSDPGCKLS